MRSTHTSIHLASAVPDHDHRPVTSLVAGAALGLLGVVNVAVGALAMVTGLVRLTPSTAGLLAVLGVVTVALGVLVARGVRWATGLALVVFVGLFVAQAGGGGGGGPAPALVTLAVVIALLVLALRAQREGDGVPDRG